MSYAQGIPWCVTCSHPLESHQHMPDKRAGEFVATPCFAYDYRPPPEPQRCGCAVYVEPSATVLPFSCRHVACIETDAGPACARCGAPTVEAWHR